MERGNVSYFQDLEVRKKSIRDAIWIHLFFWALLHIFLFLVSIQIQKNYFPSMDKMVVDPQKDEFLLRVTTENINEDNKRQISPITRLSKKDSEGKGALTQQKGINYLSPFLDFLLGKNQPETMKKTSKKKNDNKTKNNNQQKNSRLLTTEQSDFIISLLDPAQLWQRPPATIHSKNSLASRKNAIKIPEFYRFKPQMALNLSNDNRPFSFNTIKYPDYKYFQNMKKKIQENWFRNMPAGGLYLHDLDSGFYPGLNRVISFKSGVTRIAFALDRQGKIRDIRIMEQHPSPIMTKSCYLAIADSKEFGPLPESVKGERLIIPFQFIYVSE